MTDTNVAFMSKPTCKIGVTHGKFVKAMHTAVALLETRAGVNIIHSTLIPPQWRNAVKERINTKN